MTLCPNAAVFIWRNAGDEIEITRARCKSWSCPVCSEINRAMWVARMLYAVNTDDSHWSFVTLTAHERTRTKTLSHLNLQTGWNRLNLRAKRAYPGFAYVRVWELHKKGAFHAHFLWRGRPTQRWLKDNARQCGMGYMAHETRLRIQPAQAVFYVAKYMTKQASDWPVGIRRIVTSQNFPEREREHQDWHLIGTDLTVDDVTALAWRIGKNAYDLDQGKLLLLEDFITDNGEVQFSLLYD